MPTRYYIRLPNPEQARGDDPQLSFKAHGAAGFAEELQHALRRTDLFEAWRAKQDEPDDVNPALGTTDPEAVVTAEQADLHIDLIVQTILSSSILRQRMAFLAGSHWQLNDVTAA